MKIGIIGFGAIGFDVAKKLDQEKDQFNVIGVHSRTKNKIKSHIIPYKKGYKQFYSVKSSVKNVGIWRRRWDSNPR